MTAFNPGTAEERDLCVTVAAATDAAYECGDLRLVHALPSVRARGTTRTPTLLYNSRFAHPFGLVAASLSAGTSNATNVSATLTVTGPSGNIVASQNYANALFTAGSVQRLVLGFDAGALPTGVYPYTLAVSMTAGGTPVSKSATGTLLIVNRTDSPFGTGWWLAGYERIHPQPDSSLLWVGGDGSARRYAKDGAVYRAPGIDRPDSITLQGGHYVRHLRSGARVEFTPDGRHLATHDRLGLVTSFAHDAAGRLANIDPAGLPSLRYTFAYRNNTGVLETVTAPPIGSVPRVVSVTTRSDGRVSQVRDPDNTTVGFDYPNSGSFRERILSRTNRRNVVQSFAYDAAGKLVTARVPLTATDTAVTTFCPGESRGFVSTGCSAGPLHPDSAVTVVDGPRTDVSDVTTFRLDRFGAPRVIRDALGNQTQLFRGNRSFPALVTRVVHANGWVNEAFYDPKGLVTKRVEYAPLGPGSDAVTEYAWDPTWERVTQITFPERNVLQFAYDPATGNRLWQQDGRGLASRAEFTYLAPTGITRSLLSTVTYPADVQGVRSKDSVSYDALGNLAELHTATGTSAEGVSRYLNDAIGRVVRTGVDITLGGAQQRDSTVYDVMDRVLRTIASGPAMSGAAAESLFTRREYDTEGNLRRLVRWGRPDVPTTPIDSIVSRSGYDLADRPVADTAADGQVETRRYDRAGNDTSITTRRGLVIRKTFDALNRLVQRALPEVTYPERQAGIFLLTGASPPGPASNRSYPRLDKNAGGGLTIEPDTETFTYDAMGRILVARNGSAVVARSYFANGLLQTETDSVRTYNGADLTRHVYVLGYQYDLNGRRTRLTLPASLTTSPGAGTKNAISYTYDPGSGLLATVTDPLDTVFTYARDGASQLVGLQMPGGITQAWRHDPAGRPGA